MVAEGYTSLDKQAKALGLDRVHCLDDHKKETQARPLKRENDSIYFGKSRHASIGSCRDPTIRGPRPRYLARIN